MKGKLPRGAGAVGARIRSAAAWFGLRDLCDFARRSIEPVLLFLRGSLVSGAIFLLAFTPQEEQDQIVISAEHTALAKARDGRDLMVLTGNVRIEGPNLQIRADRVLLWRGEGGLEFDELYAEGGVRSSFGRGEQLGADQLFYDRAADRLAAHNLNFRSHDARTGLDSFIRAEAMWEAERGVFRAKNVIVTNCGFAEPHADFFVEEAEIRGVSPREPRGAFEFFPYEAFRVTAAGATPRLEAVPFFYLPGFSYQKGEASFLRQVRLGRSSRFGPFVETTLGIDIPHSAFDAINPFGASAPELRDQKWGEALLELDYRVERGFGGGLDFNWESKHYGGFLDTYYLYDHGANPDVGFDRRFTADGGRGRVRFFNRWELDPHWRLETEASWLSDRDLLEEFFEQEFKEGKEQETTAYLRWLDENRGGFLQGRIRVNDFQTQNEYLPRARFAWISETIPLNFLPGAISFDLSSELANVRFRGADGAGLAEDRTWRWDTVARLNAAMRLADIGVMPFVGGRITLVERNVDEEADWRGILTAGVQARMQLHRVYDVDLDEWNLHGLRHVMNFGAGVTSNLVSTADAERFFPYDPTDAADQFGELYFEMAHRLETKVRGPGGVETTRTFLRASLAGEFYPDGARDTTFFNVTSFQSPFHWIVVPADAGGAFRVRDFSNLHWELLFTPMDVLSLGVRGEVDPESWEEQFRYVGLRIVPFGAPEAEPSADPAIVGPPLVVTLQNAYARGQTNTYAANVRFSPVEKWTFEARAGYDTRTSEFRDYAFFLERDLHDFILRAGVVVNVARDDRIFAIELVPRGRRSELEFGESPYLWDTYGFGLGGRR
jgi:hypothetical protein